MQAQASWTQHDFGHLSVFQSTRLNNILHQFTMCFTKVSFVFITTPRKILREQISVMLNLMVIFDTSEFVYFQTILDMVADMKLLEIEK